MTQKGIHNTPKINLLQQHYANRSSKSQYIYASMHQIGGQLLLLTVMMRNKF